MNPVILVHGGAWDIPPAWRAHTAEGCRRAAEAGFACLRAGGSAVDAVVAAIHVLEDWPSVSAGIGAAQDVNGDIRLDASLMRGADLGCGAVAHVPPTRHPIDLARAVLDHSPHVLLVGAGALEFGRPYGVEPCAREDLIPPPEFQRKRTPSDTVGAVALDAQGRIAAGTSTGGTPGRHPARVGDVPLIGCGTYADDGAGGASATGHGEGIIRVTLARACVDALAAGQHPQAVAEEKVAAMTARVGLTGGVILVDPRGRTGRAHTTPALCWARMDADGVEASWCA